MYRSVYCLALLFLCSICIDPAWSASVVAGNDYAGTPVSFGLRDLKQALSKTIGVPGHLRIIISTAPVSKNSTVNAALKVLPKKAESFVILRRGNDIAVTGGDAVGTMYGCYELAERLEINGTKSLDIRKPIIQSPAIEFRAVNPFLVLPYKEDEKDWWFLKDDYWEGYLDQLSRARINWIDLHGMYDIKSTRFPNLYPYFLTSDKFPEAGIEPDKAKRNLDMLKKVMRMAKERGMKFAIMSYSAGWNSPGLRKSPYEGSDENLSLYTREMVRKMIQSCPDLEMIGFRIGESGKSDSFFRDSYIPAIKECGRDIPLYTRTWVVTKPPIVNIGNEFPGRFFIEIKYNGEQFGPPYIVSGGRMLINHSYSYQNYYSYPKPYKIIYQLRANGTHRVFPWGNPEIAARANSDSTMGGAVGLCVEPIDAYYPKYDSRHKDDSPNRWYNWQYQRDWYWYNVWGRTAYDPGLAKNHKVWVHMFARHFNKSTASALYKAMNEASRIIPDLYTSYAIGRPDHRDHAPELETGGTVKDWANGAPFDIQNVQTPREFAERLVTGSPSAKATPLEMAGRMSLAARETRKWLEAAKRLTTGHPTPEFNDLVTELTALSCLGDYYSHKMKAAAIYALMEASSDINQADLIRKELTQAHKAWNDLAEIGEEHYKPFVDMLRMWDEEYTWTKEGEKLKNDFTALDQAVEAIKASGKIGRAPNYGLKGDGKGPSISKVIPTVTSIDRNRKIFRVSALLDDPRGVSKVYLKFKPFASDRLWSLKPMTVKNHTYAVEVEVLSEGMMWCIEAIDNDGNGTLWPDFRKETPYRCILPWDAPLPWGDAEAALRKIESIRPSRSDFSAMLIGNKAWTVNGMPAEVKSSILESIKNGLSLVVLAQDDPKVWDGSWFGGGISFVGKKADDVRFIANHPILQGVPSVLHEDEIVYNPMEDGDSSWTHLADPKVLAIRQLGRGRIVLVQMNIRNSIWQPQTEKLFRNVINYAKDGSDKPILIIDPGGAASWSMLDYIDEPYVRLGEIPTSDGRSSP